MKLSQKKDLFKDTLGLEYKEHEDGIWLKSSIILRRLIGALGILLPLLLWFFLWISTGRMQVLESISHYYYTRVDTVFIITICLTAIFLIVYKGKNPMDFILSLLAGTCALLLLIFPTSTIICKYPDVNFFYSNTILSDNSTRINVHYFSAGIFILTLAIISMWLFRKSNKKKSERGIRKMWRNRIYTICGIGMISAIIIIFLRKLGWINAEFYDERNLTFWMEVVAIELFGVSWLIKGETLIKDHNK